MTWETPFLLVQNYTFALLFVWQPHDRTTAERGHSRRLDECIDYER